MELIANIHREDGHYWASVSELPGCFASGDTLDELFDSLHEGIRLCLEGDVAAGEELPAPSLELRTAVLSDAAAV